jgi:hypothetical protein
MTDLAPGVPERIIAQLARPPRDWIGATELALTLDVPAPDILSALHRLAAAGQAHRELHSDGDHLVVRWRIAR